VFPRNFRVVKIQIFKFDMFAPSEQIAISPRTALVDTKFVRAARGVDTDKVFTWVDCGQLLWVWNVTSNLDRRKRDLRFWSKEISKPNETAALSLDQVIQNILPPGRSEYPSGELTLLLQVSRPHLAQLRKEISGAPRTGPVPRAGLEGFLRRRWIGGNL
jgi:hypothetical protein